MAQKISRALKSCALSASSAYSCTRGREGYCGLRAAWVRHHSTCRPTHKHLTMSHVGLSGVLREFSHKWSPARSEVLPEKACAGAESGSPARARSGLYVEGQRPRGECNLLVVLRTSNDFNGHSDKTRSFASLNRKMKFPL